MPRGQKGEPSQRCLVCRHPEAKAIDRSITAGIPYRDILKNYPGFSMATLENHSRNHVIWDRDELVRAAKEVAEGDLDLYSKPLGIELNTLPDDLVLYGMKGVHESLDRLRDLAIETRSLRAEEVLLKGWEVWLRYAEYWNKNQQTQVETSTVLNIIEVPARETIDGIDVA